MAEYGKRCKINTKFPLQREKNPSSRIIRFTVSHNGSVFFINTIAVRVIGATGSDPLINDAVWYKMVSRLIGAVTVFPIKSAKPSF